MDVKGVLYSVARPLLTQALQYCFSHTASMSIGTLDKRSRRDVCLANERQSKIYFVQIFMPW